MYVVRAAPGGYFTYLLTLTTSGSRSQVILLDFMSRNGTSFKTPQQTFYISLLSWSLQELTYIQLTLTVWPKATLEITYPIDLKIRPKR